MRQVIAKKAVAGKVVRVGMGMAAVLLLLPLSALAVTTVDIDLKPENNDNVVDPFNLGSSKSVEVAVFSTDQMDAEFIDPFTVELGDPLLTVTMPALSWTFKDVNGDGLGDVVFDFGPAHGFGDSGALNGDSTHVELTGTSFQGIPIIGPVAGLDEVRIVGGD